MSRGNGSGDVHVNNVLPFASRSELVLDVRVVLAWWRGVAYVVVWKGERKGTEQSKFYSGRTPTGLLSLPVKTVKHLPGSSVEKSCFGSPTSHFTPTRPNRNPTCLSLDYGTLTSQNSQTSSLWR